MYRTLCTHSDVHMRLHFHSLPQMSVGTPTCSMTKIVFSYQMQELKKVLAKILSEWFRLATPQADHKQIIRASVAQER